MMNSTPFHHALVLFDYLLRQVDKSLTVKLSGFAPHCLHRGWWHTPEESWSVRRELYLKYNRNLYHYIKTNHIILSAYWQISPCPVSHAPIKLRRHEELSIFIEDGGKFIARRYVEVTHGYKQICRQFLWVCPELLRKRHMRWGLQGITGAWGRWHGRWGDEDARG